MRLGEKFARTVRHAPLLRRATWLWDRVRPLYERALEGTASRSGLERVINGTDRLLVSPTARGTPESVEPEFWAHLMAEMVAGSTFVDVGSNVGLYAIAAGKRVGETGKVIAFEPDHANFALLENHVRLNGLSHRIEIHQVAVGREDGVVAFEHRGDSESHVAVGAAGAQVTRVPMRSLDSVLNGRVVDVIKVDVEGYEEEVLRGASGLLGDRERRPRALFIEAHPFAWGSVGTTSDTLLGYLAGFGYEMRFLDGTVVNRIERYGSFVARQNRLR
jgi:FkbM family methyltransferase